MLNFEKGLSGPELRTFEVDSNQRTRRAPQSEPILPGCSLQDLRQLETNFLLYDLSRAEMRPERLLSVLERVARRARSRS